MFLSKRENGIWYLWYKTDFGKKLKVSTGARRKSEAFNFLRDFHQTKRVPENPGKQIYLTQFTHEFLPYAQSTFSRATFHIYEVVLKRFLMLTGDVPLNSITPLHLDRYRIDRLGHKTKRGTTLSPVSVNIELRALRAAMNTAVRWNLIEIGPCARMRQMPVADVQPAYFTKEDFNTLLKAIREQWLRELLVFAVSTGMRRGEILNLRWQDVDLERRLIHIQSNPTFRTKMGKRRVIPMNEIVYALLCRKNACTFPEYVFHRCGRKISENHATKKLKSYIYETGLPAKLHFHSLRHTFASWLVQSGTPIYEVQRLLGHGSINVTQVYSHLQPEQLHSTVNKISPEFS